MPVTLTDTTKFARSLNCAKCQQPFSSTANEPRTPRMLTHSSPILCQECFDGEKAKTIKKRWHQCEDGDLCLKSRNPAYYVMDLISLGSLALNSSKSGYILVKDFLAPECPICHKNYDIRDVKKTLVSLYCGHAICMECYQKRRGEDDHEDNYKDSIKCPNCRVRTFQRGEGMQTNIVNDFLHELPELVDEFEYFEYSKTKCTSCKEKFHMDCMYFCDDCDVEICGACAHRKHRTHETVDLTKEKGKWLSEVIEKMTTNQIETHEKVYPELHMDLMAKVEDFKQKLKKSIRSLVNIEKHDELNKKQREYRKIGEKFETISEEYLSSLRGYDTKLQGLLEEFSTLQMANKEVK